jgi:hypothetical protein
MQTTSGKKGGRERASSFINGRKRGTDPELVTEEKRKNYTQNPCTSSTSPRASAGPPPRRLSSAEQHHHRAGRRFSIATSTPLRCSDAAALRPKRWRRLAAQRRAVRTPASGCLHATATAPLFQIEMRGPERNEREIEREHARMPRCYRLEVGHVYVFCMYLKCILRARRTIPNKK